MEPYKYGNKMIAQDKSKKPISSGRHSRNCTIYAHKYHEEIEQEFINWTSQEAIHFDVLDSNKTIEIEVNEI